MRMHEKGLVLSAVLLLLAALACQKNGSAWKGKVEKVRGVTIVQNPKTPMRAADDGPFKLTKELIIGAKETSAGPVFSQIQALDVDEAGNIYVLDQREAQVKVFDAKGTLLRTVGRRGQGPGEMQYPGFVQLSVGGRVFVYDYGAARCLFFSRNGVFLQQKSSGKPLSPVKMSARGLLVGWYPGAPPPRDGKILEICDPDSQQSTVIARDEPGQDKVFDIGKPTTYACIGPNDEIIWGNSGEYAIHITDLAGETTKIISKEYRPIPISSADKREFEERYIDAVQHGMRLSFRSHFPAFGGIFTDSEGRILVKTYERSPEPKGGFIFDVFDAEGRFTAKTAIGANLNERSIWKNGKLYTIEADGEDLPIVVRYRVDWM